MSNNGPLTATNRADASHNDNAVERATPDPDPDTQRRVLAGKLLDLIAGLVVNSPDELIDFCNDAARHLVSTGVTVNEPAAGQ